MGIQRYKLEEWDNYDGNDEWCGMEMELQNNEDGEWVKYDDIKHLLVEPDSDVKFNKKHYDSLVAFANNKSNEIDLKCIRMEKEISAYRNIEMKQKLKDRIIRAIIIIFNLITSSKQNRITR